MEFYQDDDWLEEESEEVCGDGIEYLYETDDLEASDQIVPDLDSLHRMDSEWKPSEAEDDEAVDEVALSDSNNTKAKVKQENKYPKRKKNTGTANRIGMEVRAAI
jgi:hypothetical protein